LAAIRVSAISIDDHDLLDRRSHSQVDDRLDELAKKILPRSSDL
jgi:hypothetical protein